MGSGISTVDLAEEGNVSQGSYGRLERRAAPREQATRRNECETAGRCGPFVNLVYEQGIRFGDCVECGRTVAVPGDRGFESLGRIEAFFPPVMD